MRINNRLIANVAFATALLAGLTTSLSGAQASVVYSEDFNSPGFRNSQIFPDPYSDKYNPASYWTINNFNGWSFTPGSTFVSLDGSATDGAVLLNENNPGTSASTTINGLTPNTTYTLSFDVWGDNRPGQPWVLNVAVNGNGLLNLPGVDLAPGANPGTHYTLSFTTTGTTAFLFFSEATPGGSQASPIFDNVQVSTTPLPAALPLFATGVGALGLIGWRRKRKNAAALATA